MSTNNRKKTSRPSNNFYIAAALCVFSIGLLALILALSLSGCNTSDSSESSIPPIAESSIEIIEESDSDSEISLTDSIDEESSEDESWKYSDLPVVIENQPVPTQKYEVSVGVRYSIDMSEFEQFVAPEDPLEYVFLVNPTHTLASDYEAEDMIDCVYTRKDGRAMQKMRLYAEKALEAFLAEGANFNVTNVTVTSAYRSYSYQGTLFNRYCEQNQSKFKTREECEAYVLTFSTKPGTSEHQSGLCCDMHNMGSAQASFAKKPEAKWLAENCWRFGFILRYPEDKVDITKITYEPWHFRFVGREAATEMHNLGMCLEEYCQYKGIDTVNVGG